MKKKLFVSMFLLIVFLIVTTSVLAADYCPVCSSSNTYRYCDGIYSIVLVGDHPVDYQGKAYGCDIYNHYGRTNVQCDNCGHSYMVTTHTCIIEHLITQCPAAGQNDVCPF